MDFTKAKYYRVLILFLVFFGIAAGVHALKVTLNHLADPSVYIPQIEKSLEKNLNADIKIKDIQWITWGGLGIEVNGMQITSENESLNFGRVVLIVRLLPLLKKQIIIRTIRVSNTDIDIVSNNKGTHSNKIIHEAIRYLNTPLTSFSGFSLGTAIRSFYINDIRCSLNKKNSKKPESIDLKINDFEFEISDFFDTVDFNFSGTLAASDKKVGTFKINEKIEDITSDEFFVALLNDSAQTSVYEQLFKDKHHTFSFTTKNLPLGNLFRFADLRKDDLLGEELSGDLTVLGVNSLNYRGSFAVRDSKGKALYEPKFSGVIHENGVTLSNASLLFDGIPIKFGGELNSLDSNNISLLLKSDVVEIEKLAKNKRILNSSSKAKTLFKKILKGKLTITEFKTFFPKIDPSNGELYIYNLKGVVDELSKNFIAAKGTLKEAVIVTASTEKNKLVSVDFQYNGSLLRLFNGRIAIKKNFIDIANVIYDPKTETAEGKVAFVLQNIPLSVIDANAPKNRELYFVDKPAFPAEFKANIAKKTCSLSAIIDQEKGSIKLQGGDGTIVYHDLKGDFNLTLNGESSSFIANVEQAGATYGETEIKELSFDIIKRRKFLTHHVKRLFGTVNIEDIVDVYGFLDPDSAKAINAKGTVLADLRAVEERGRIDGELDIQNLLFPYVDEITEKSGTVTVNGNASVVLKEDLSDFIRVAFKNIKLQDSFNGEINLTGKAWKVREKLFTNLGLKGTFDAGALKVAYENIVGEDFFLSTGFEGFYGITGKAEIEGKIKGNVTDRPEDIDLKINLLDLALLDSDNGNLWDKITGDTHITSSGTSVRKFQYFVGENRYLLEDSKISFDKEGRSYYHINGKGFINLEKYRDDNKLFSRSLKSLDITSMKGDAFFSFKVDEEKEKTHLELKYDFEKADFLFWKDIHKHEGEKLKVNLKGYLLNDPSKVYFKTEECLIDYLEDKYLMVNSEFFDNNIFDIHLSTSKARLGNLLKLVDFHETDQVQVGGDFKGVINIKNFGNAITIKGIASLNSFFFKYGDDTFLAPAIEISCGDKLCTTESFLIKANDENIPINKTEISVTGKNFNRHALSLQLYADEINFDKIYGQNFYQDWYKESIGNRVTEDSEEEFVPQDTSENCIYCDHNKYDIGLTVNAITINQQQFENFTFHLSSQYGIVNLDDFSAEYNDGSIFYQGRYNSFKEKPASFQGKMTNLDLNIINAFIPDLSFFSSGKGDLSFYFSSSVNSKEIYDYAKGELNFDFKNGSIDRYKWFKKINYKSDKSEKELQRLPRWKFSEINGNAVIFGDKINVKKLFVDGEDKNIAARGTFAIKPKEIDFTLAAYPLARMEDIPFVGQLLADFVLYYGISGNLQEVTTEEIQPEKIPSTLLDSFSTIIGETKTP